ncbi:MAG TPA: cyclic nucleotide-binding domain-containing protein [Mariprofundaceae bacterium]|nr:cyclic nucleotide-binding domain-containing protein [Mariprofundaceae bacterium]
MYPREDFSQAFEASVAANPMYSRFRRMPVSQELGLRESMLLFSCFEPRVIPEGSVIYEANTPSENEMYLIVEGTVSVSSASQDIYESLRPGDVFGLFSFLDEGRLHSATVTTTSELTVLVINRDYFDVITLEDPALGNEMLRFMFRMLSRMALKLESEYAAIHRFATGRRI